MARYEQIDTWLTQLSYLRRVALDTNVIIYKLEGPGRYNRLVEPVFQLLGRGRLVIVISRVAELEALVKPLRENDLATADLFTLLLTKTPNILIRDVDSAVARRAAQIRARTGLRVPDAIIAATALEEKCDALIGNDAMMASRFVGIPYLYLQNYIS